MEQDNRLGTRIKAWREKAELTQSQLAAKVGVSREAVCQWESSDTDPSQGHLAATVDAFGITMTKFYGAVPKKRRAA